MTCTGGPAGIPVSPWETAITPTRPAGHPRSAAFAFSLSRNQLRSHAGAWVLLPTAPRGSQPAAPRSPRSDTAEKRPSRSPPLRRQAGQGGGKAAARLADPPAASQKQRESATQRARRWNRKSGRGCDSRAEECKHTLLVALDFSLVFDKARPRKVCAASIFRHKSIAWRVFFPATLGSYISPRLLWELHTASSCLQISGQTLIKHYFQQFCRAQDTYSGRSCTCQMPHLLRISPALPHTPQFFQWGFWLSRAY